MTSRPASDYQTAALHVGFELTSMVEMTLRFNSHTTDALVGIALLEGTLLHCRNIIDFLGPWRHWEDDIVPDDFVAGWDPRLLQVSDAARTAIHKHLAHLTWARVSEGQVPWEHPEIASAAFDAMGKFVDLVEAQESPVAPIFRAHHDQALVCIREAASSSDDPLVLVDFL